MAPRIAVILPVYNAEKYVAEAICSVLEQTYADFHLFVIDDGSTDRTADVITGFTDPRLRHIRFRRNRGLVAALNAGIEQSQSELIARMDADDVCLPRRFERQVAFLDAHPHVMMCGTWTRQFGDKGGVRRPPADPVQLHARLFFGFALDHPSIVMRRAFLEAHGLAYREEYRHVEDFDLFFRAAALGAIANVPEILLRTRAHDAEVSIVHVAEQIRTEARLRAGQLRLLIPDATADDEAFHGAVLDGAIHAKMLPSAEAWLVRLADANAERGLYEGAAFRREVRSLYYRLHVQARALRATHIVAFVRSPLLGGWRDRLVHALGLSTRVTLRIVRWACRLARPGRVCEESSARRPEA